MRRRWADSLRRTERGPARGRVHGKSVRGRSRLRERFWRGGEVTGGDGVAEELLDRFAEDGRAVGDRAATDTGLVVSDAMFAPAPAFGVGVEEHGLEAVAGVGKFRLGSGAGFELVPEGTELARLIGREEAEDAVGGADFAIVLCGGVDGVVGEGIAGVDFHEVMDEAHFEHAEDVEVGDVGVFGEDDDAEAEGPGVFGVVLGTTALRVDRLAEYFLQFVALGDEGNLLGETGGRVFGERNHERHERHERLAGNAGGGETARDSAGRSAAVSSGPVDDGYFNSGATNGVHTA